MVKGQLQGAIVCAVKRIGYNNVKELQFEVIPKVITGNKKRVHVIRHASALYNQLLNFSLSFCQVYSTPYANDNVFRHL